MTQTKTVEICYSCLTSLEHIFEVEDKDMVDCEARLLDGKIHIVKSL